MAEPIAAHFSGPILSGTIRESNGDTPVLGMNVPNTGYTMLTQSVSLTQNGSQTSSGGFLSSIVIPSYSMITAIQIIAAPQWGTTSISVGTSVTSTASLAIVSAAGALSMINFSPAGDAQANLWKNIGAVDARIWISSGAAGPGVGTMIVSYIPAINAPDTP